MAVAATSDNKLCVTVESKNSCPTRRNSDISDVICCLHVPNKLLCQWRRREKEHSASGYIACVNEAITDGVITVDSECERLSNRIASQAATIQSKLHKLRPGGACMKLLSKHSSFDLRKGETVSATHLMDVIDDNIEQIEEWKSRCHHREVAVLQLAEKIRQHHRSKRTDTDRQLAHPQTSSKESFVNLGQPISEVSARQQRRKLSQLKMSIERALWFVDSFGLDLKSITVANNGRPFNISFDESPDSDELLDSTAQMLYLLERFGVSDEFYHELSMANTSLPRSHLVKKARQTITESIDIIRLPDPYHGAYRKFEHCLAEAIAYELDKPNVILKDKVAVKLSGDGAQFSKTSKFVLLSFSLPTLSNDMLSGHGNHTFAAVKGNEDYALLKEAFEPVLNELNHMIASSAITVVGRQMDLEFFLGSDYEFLLLVMGFNAAHSDYCCLWCNIHKGNRWDMSFPEDEYTSKRSRTLAEIKACSKLPSRAKPAQRLGCMHLPLLEIKPDHIIVDELHLLLRISDRLIDNIVIRAAELDHRARVHVQGTCDDTSMNRLLQAIHSCGVHFQIWTAKDSDGRVTPGKYQWTSLNGSERISLLRKLPPSIPSLVGGEASILMQQLWEDFLEIYLIVANREPSPEQCSGLHEKSKAWVNLFTSLGKHYQGFQKARVTPYMHVLVYHVPKMIRQLGNIFSGQGVEKNNDIAKCNYFSSNKHDAVGDILKTEARFETLTRGTANISSCVREKRAYTKKDSYWLEGGIIASRSKRIHEDSENAM